MIFNGFICDLQLLYKFFISYNVVFENKSQYCFDHFAGSHCYLYASGVMLRHSTPSRLPQCENLEIFNQETKTILDTVKENLLFLPQNQYRNLFPVATLHR